MTGATKRENLEILTDRLCETQLSPERIEACVKSIYESMLSDSPNIREGHLTTISGLDLRKLYELYDGVFFDGLLDRLFNQEGLPSLSFRAAPRMTSAGGKTSRKRTKTPEPTPGDAIRYEIAISSTLLFQTFSDVNRTISVNGIVCRDRLEALQRIFEHELVHLLEWLTWNRTSCKAARFQTIARNFFGHTEATHRLVTQRERAREVFGIHAGDQVVFEYEGERLIGRVNRITKRATVLVASDEGARYSDGGRYEKYYIPLEFLEKLS